MGCACKVNQRINEIHKRYGVNRNIVKTNITEKIKIGLKQSFIYLLCLPLIPLMIIYIGWMGFIKKRPISIKKLFKLKR